MHAYISRRVSACLGIIDVLINESLLCFPSCCAQGLYQIVDLLDESQVDVHALCNGFGCALHA